LELESGVLEEQAEGFWGIDNHAVLQSGLYEAAYHVIGALILVSQQARNRDWR
jgi:hypothetical protein